MLKIYVITQIDYTAEIESLRITKNGTKVLWSGFTVVEVKALLER